MIGRERSSARPVVGSILGSAGVAAIVSVVVIFDVSSNVRPGLLLVLPIVVAAVIGGQVGGLLVATVATLGYTLVLPPRGFRIIFPDGLIALGVFFVVAITMSTLVARRLDALRRVEQQQRALLRSVSHDLRTPLAVIRGASSELADEEAHYDEASRQRLLVLIERESERLDRLVANLLSLSRIEAGANTLDRQSIDLAELVEDAAAPLQHVFDDRELVVDLPADLPLIEADFVQLGQLVSNLIENAARHAPVGGRVTVGGAATDRSVMLWFDDDGPGVPPEDRAEIFTPFRSGANAGSTGIGLAICQAVANAHGGTIEVRESQPGGARFIITLPR